MSLVCIRFATTTASGRWAKLLRSRIRFDLVLAGGSPVVSDDWIAPEVSTWSVATWRAVRISWLVW
jgi:hypothetical protein